MPVQNCADPQGRDAPPLPPPESGKAEFNPILADFVTLRFVHEARSLAGVTSHTQREAPVYEAIHDVIGTQTPRDKGFCAPFSLR